MTFKLIYHECAFVFVYVCVFLHAYMWTVCVVLQENRKGNQFLWCQRQLKASMWVLGTQARSSVRTASDLNC